MGGGKSWPMGPKKFEISKTAQRIPPKILRQFSHALSDLNLNFGRDSSIRSREIIWECGAGCCFFPSMPFGRHMRHMAENHKSVEKVRKKCWASPGVLAA